MLTAGSSLYLPQCRHMASGDLHLTTSAADFGALTFPALRPFLLLPLPPFTAALPAVGASEMALAHTCRSIRCLVILAGGVGKVWRRPRLSRL